MQDQTVKVAEARELEGELHRLRAENADFRKRIGEVSNLESAKKKADVKIDQLEHRVRDCSNLPLPSYMLIFS